MYHAFNSFFVRVPSLHFYSLKEESFRMKIYDSKFQEAIYLASPDLFNELQKYLTGMTTNANEKQRIELALYRYISRMSTRCTPFGLFAGCSMGDIIDGPSDVILKDTLRNTRLDMHFLCVLSQELSKLSGRIKENIKYYPNTSLYKIGKKYRYVEYYYLKSHKKYQISNINHSVYIDAVLEIAKKGVKIETLLNYFIEHKIEKNVALGFVNELIYAQVLVDELNPSAIGGDYLKRIVHVLNDLSVSDMLMYPLKEIQLLLHEIDNNQQENMVLYKKIIRNIESLKIPFEEKSLFQVDMTRSVFKATLGNRIVDELQSAMIFLNKITPVRKKDALYEFQKAFFNRYEDKEVSLMEALDTELGIGYPINKISRDVSPLLDDFYIPNEGYKKQFQSNPFISILLKKTISAEKKNEIEIVFNDDDVEKFKLNWDDLPLTIYSMFKILKTDLYDAPMIHLTGFYGTCGANLFARFAYMDENINRFVSEITTKEQELMPNVIFAEIVHLSEPRTGNVLSRTHIRDYEILYLSNSDLPQSRIIYTSDLFLSIRQGRLYLRSKELNKEIIPRLTNAHNYCLTAIPVYYFLCDLQNQYGRTSLALNWEYLDNDLSFLPRVRYKNTILSLATWKIVTLEMKYLFVIENDNQLLFEVNKWREKYILPSKVILVDGDNELFVDLEIALSVKALFSIIKKREIICLKEFLFDPKSPLVRDRNGNCFTNECIVSFYKKVK